MVLARLEDHVGAVLRHRRLHRGEAGQGTAGQTDLVARAPAIDRIAAGRAVDEEHVGTGAADEHVVSARPIEGHVVGVANDDQVVEAIARRIKVVARDIQILDIVRQGVIHPGSDGIHPRGPLHDHVSNAGKIILIISRPAYERVISCCTEYIVERVTPKNLVGVRCPQLHTIGRSRLRGRRAVIFKIHFTRPLHAG